MLVLLPNRTGIQVCERFDSTGDVGRYSSLAVHSDGSIHISYYYVNGANEWLKYARF